MSCRNGATAIPADQSNRAASQPREAALRDSGKELLLRSACFRWICEEEIRCSAAAVPYSAGRDGHHGRDENQGPVDVNYKRHRARGHEKHHNNWQRGAVASQEVREWSTLHREAHA